MVTPVTQPQFNDPSLETPTRKAQGIIQSALQGMAAPFYDLVTTASISTRDEQLVKIVKPFMVKRSAPVLNKPTVYQTKRIRQVRVTPDYADIATMDDEFIESLINQEGTMHGPIVQEIMNAYDRMIVHMMIESFFKPTIAGDVVDGISGGTREETYNPLAASTSVSVSLGAGVPTGLNVAKLIELSRMIKARGDNPSDYTALTTPDDEFALLGDVQATNTDYTGTAANGSANLAAGQITAFAGIKLRHIPYTTEGEGFYDHFIPDDSTPGSPNPARIYLNNDQTIRYIPVIKKQTLVFCNGPSEMKSGIDMTRSGSMAHIYKWWIAAARAREEYAYVIQVKNG